MLWVDQEGVLCHLGGLKEHGNLEAVLQIYQREGKGSGREKEGGLWVVGVMCERKTIVSGG